MTDDPRIEELFKFTYEAELTPGYGDSYLFFVGRDQVHEILNYILSNEKLALKLSMYGYDDAELNKTILKMMKDKNIRVQISLDKSQASGVHEKPLLDADRKLDAVAFKNSFVITTTSSGQILHTKGGVCLGSGIAFEGSTNWSASGEGIGTGNNVKGVKAQSNTLLVTTNPVIVQRFTANLDNEHASALARQAKK
jgi:hypothetical protein